MIVVKKDGSRELFDRNKILTGILAACYKQNVSSETVDRMVSEVEGELKNTLRTEVTSQEIGHLVMEKLKAVNEVSYVRFASVYREFKDVDTFLDEIDHLLRRGKA
jgi:transcriptional repressor NrdR